MKFGSSNKEESNRLENSLGDLFPGAVLEPKRKKCIVCKTRVGAKQIKGSKVYYRAKCWECALTAHQKLRQRERCRRRYELNGYDPKQALRNVRLKRPWTAHKKDSCEKCGFVPVHSCQLDVDHIDGNKLNNNLSNYQTLCANCHRLKTFQNSEGVWQRIHKIIKVVKTETTTVETKET